MRASVAYVPRWLPLAAVGAVSTGWFLAVYLAHGPQDPSIVRGDAVTYLQAYEDPRSFVEAPYSFRVLTPIVAGIASDDPSRAFLITTLLGLVATTVILFELVEGFAGRGSAVMAAALFAASPLATISLKNHFLADPLAVAFMAGAVLAAVRGRWAVASAAVALGTLARENALVVLVGILPALVARRRWPLAAAVALPGIAAYLLLHHTALWFGEVPSESYFTWDRMYGNLTESGRLTVDVPEILLVALGPVAVAAWFGARRAPGLLRWAALVVIPVLAGNLIASDSLRLTSYAFVVTSPLAAALPWRTLPGIAFVGMVWLLGDAVQLIDGAAPKLVSDLLVGGLALLALAWQLRSSPVERRGSGLGLPQQPSG